MMHLIPGSIDLTDPTIYELSQRIADISARLTQQALGLRELLARIDDMEMSDAIREYSVTEIDMRKPCQEKAAGQTGGSLGETPSRT